MKTSRSLRLFQTETEYNNVKKQFKYPTLSHIVNGSSNIVKYMNKPDYSTMYLTFEALEDSTFTLTVPANVNSTYMTSISYSIDEGETWVDTMIDNTLQTISTPTVQAGTKILWKGVGTQMSTNTSTTGSSRFAATANFKVSGNIMSLIYGDDFIDNKFFTSGTTYNFSCLFYQVSKLVSAENLILSAVTLTNYCYSNMFYKCTSLTTAPILSATTLADYCYNYMFDGCTALTLAPVLSATTLASNCYNNMFNYCTSLTTAPELPATTLASNCYTAMFRGCISLTTAPVLSATTLANDCYQNMFYGCTSLTIAPELPGTIMTYRCYSNMFNGCTSLTIAPELPATTLATYCYNNMFNDCTSLTTAPELPATTLADYCYLGMFYNCTSLITAPELSATTLKNGCYQNMFYGCISLTTAPILPATTLVLYCYSNMFSGCTRLNYIKAMFRTTPSTTYTPNWVQGVAATGTFVKKNTATWNVSGVNGIPSGWTVQTAAS